MKKEDMRKYFICFFSVSILLMTAGCSSVFYVS